MTSRSVDRLVAVAEVPAVAGDRAVGVEGVRRRRTTTGSPGAASRSGPAFGDRRRVDRRPPPRRSRPRRAGRYCPGPSGGPRRRPAARRCGVTRSPVAVVPSLKSQRYSAMSPSGSSEPRAREDQLLAGRADLVGAGVGDRRLVDQHVAACRVALLRIGAGIVGDGEPHVVGAGLAGRRAPARALRRCCRRRSPSRSWRCCRRDRSSRAVEAHLARGHDLVRAGLRDRRGVDPRREPGRRPCWSSSPKSSVTVSVTW